MAHLAHELPVTSVALNRHEREFVGRRYFHSGRRGDLRTIRKQTTVNVVCSQCTAVNRVPESKLHDRPICAKCKYTLLPPHAIELTESTFNKFVTRTELPVLVDFWAPWCGPCRMMAPAFAEAAEELSPRMVLAKLNTESAPHSAGQFSITGIPTMILFHHGKEVARQSGAMNAQQIVQWASHN